MANEEKKENSELPYGAILGALLGAGKGYFGTNALYKKIPQAEALLPKKYVLPFNTVGAALGTGYLGNEAQEGNYEGLGADLGMGLGGYLGMKAGKFLPKKGRIDKTLPKTLKGAPEGKDKDAALDMLRIASTMIAGTIAGNYGGGALGRSLQNYRNPYGKEEGEE